MSFRRMRTLSILLYAFPLLVTTFASTGTWASVNINADVNAADADVRQANDVLRTNVVAYTYEWVRDSVWDKFFDEQRVGDILVDMSEITRNAKDFSDLKRRIRDLGAFVSRVKAAGGRVQFVFQNGMPKWLSSDPDNNGDLFEGGLSEGQKIWHSVPPSDYKIWGEVAYEIVNYFNNELNAGESVYYIIGSEPQYYWVGNEDEWHQYYEYFVKGALKADPKAKVGGINTNGISSKKFTKDNPQKQGGKIVFKGSAARGNKSILYNWLEYSAKKKLPVDVITWHDYPAPSPIPGEYASWVGIEKQLKKWLSEFGYSNTELIVDDWPEWEPVVYENDSEFQAAYVVNSLITMIEHTEVKALYLNILDILAYVDVEEKRKNASFGGGNGMFTGLGLAKPVYNAYALMSKMEGRLIPVQTGDEFVRALASSDDDNVYLLLANFIPSKRLITRNSYGADKDALAKIDRAALAEKYKKLGKNRKQVIESILNNSIDIQKLDLPAATKQRISGMKEVYTTGMQRMKAPANVQIQLNGFNLGREGRSLNYDEYVIDRTHANSYSARHKFAEQARSSGVMKNKSSKRKFLETVHEQTGIESGRIERSDATVHSGAVEINVTLEPNSVHLIVLQRDKAN